MHNSFHHLTFTPLKNLIRTADYSSSRLPVTDLNEAPQRGADSNLRRYKMERIPPNI